MDDKDLTRLVDEINRLMACEQAALKDDHPDSTCAARHRGEIAAYGRILKEIMKMIKETNHEQKS